MISVSADPDIPRDRVLDAAHEVAACARSGREVPTRSLFDLPLGSGHSWRIDEREIRTRQPGEHVEHVTGVSLPAWHIKERLELKASPLFGSAPALATMGDLISDPGGATEATQVALASFTRYGFEAAAVTAFARVAAAFRAPDERGTERTAILRFDHPYAALAIAGGPAPSGADRARRTQAGSSFTGLPLFTAWVAVPEEAEQ